MANTAYPFRVTDNSGVLVSGATITVGAVGLTAGTPANVPAAKGLSTGAGVNGSTGPSVEYLDFGNGDYVLIYDPESYGEIYVGIVPSKSGSTITNANALIPVICTKDSSRVQTALPNASIAAQTGDSFAIVNNGTYGNSALNAAIATVETHAANADSQSAANQAALALMQGLIGQNQGVRNQQYDANGNLTSADICAYDNATHAALNDGATGLAHKWTLTLTYTGTQQATQTLAQVS